MWFSFGKVHSLQNRMVKENLKFFKPRSSSWQMYWEFSYKCSYKDLLVYGQLYTYTTSNMNWNSGFIGLRPMQWIISCLNIFRYYCIHLLLSAKDKNCISFMTTLHLCFFFFYTVDIFSCTKALTEQWSSVGCGSG